MPMFRGKWRNAGGLRVDCRQDGEDQEETCCRAGSAPPRQQGEGENVTWGWVQGTGCDCAADGGMGKERTGTSERDAPAIPGGRVAWSLHLFRMKPPHHDRFPRGNSFYRGGDQEQNRFFS